MSTVKEASFVENKVHMPSLLWILISIVILRIGCDFARNSKEATPFLRPLKSRGLKAFKSISKWPLANYSSRKNPGKSSACNFYGSKKSGELYYVLGSKGGFLLVEKALDGILGILLTFF